MSILVGSIMAPTFLPSAINTDQVLQAEYVCIISIGIVIANFKSIYSLLLLSLAGLPNIIKSKVEKYIESHKNG